MGGAVNLDMSEVTDFLTVAGTVPEISRDKAVTAVELGMGEWERQTIARTPYNQGHLRGGFSYKVTRGHSVIKGELTNAMNRYALVMEKGRRPNKTPPPWEPIALWLVRKGYAENGPNLKGIAIYTAIRIGKRGIKPHNMVRDGLDASNSYIMKQFEKVAGDTLKTLERS